MHEIGLEDGMRFMPRFWEENGHESIEGDYDINFSGFKTNKPLEECERIGVGKPRIWEGGYQ